MTIDGWECTELHAEHEWRARYASRGCVQWSADSGGLELEEIIHGYEGGAGRYQLTANVAMWLMQVVR